MLSRRLARLSNTSREARDSNLWSGRSIYRPVYLHVCKVRKFASRYTKMYVYAYTYLVLLRKIKRPQRIVDKTGPTRKVRQGRLEEGPQRRANS